MSAERVFAELQTDASTLHASIRLHLERNFAPDARKYLRTFSSTEAADFLGLAPRNVSTILRQLLLNFKLGLPLCSLVG